MQEDRIGRAPAQAAESVLEYWLGERSETPPEEGRVARWFVANPDVDAEIRERFEPLVEEALAGGLMEWETTTGGRVASIVLLDQFPRNLFRDQARAFQGDARALALTRSFTPLELDGLHPLEHYFVLLPWMHSESLEAQRAGEAAFARAAEAAGEAFRSLFDGGLSYATRHRLVIERFGRFPHRNAALGRVSTAEEIAFMEEVGMGF
ncbi:MAG: DUF924 domain-containing protein [Deltaproteobacteria bacterium]|jgi:uncharacterized protein (DUF924 family)|nr:DUF924 domain-containing protein [Deltaproteobacteria bacterium]